MALTTVELYKKYCNSPWGIFRREMILRGLLSKAIEKDSFLDIGCGTGSVLTCLCNSFHSGVAIDNSMEMLNSIESHGYDNLQLFNDDFNSFSFDGLYDLILCHNVMEYQPKDIFDSFLDKISSLLKNGNSIFSLVVMNREVEVVSLLTNGLLERAEDLYLNGNYWSNTFRKKLYLPSVSEIKNLLIKNGFIINAEYGIGLMKQRDYNALDNIELYKRINIEQAMQSTSMINNSILIHFICKKRFADLSI